MLQTLTAPRESIGFWAWFAEHGPRVRELLAAGEPFVVDELRYRFHRSHPELVWETLPAEAGDWTFVVGAGGIRDFFPKVLAVVREAPLVRGWNVRAFRPRSESSPRLRICGVSLDFDDVVCAIEPESTGVRLRLHVRGIADEAASDVDRVAAILLDHAVGEWEAAMRITAVSTAPLGEAPPDAFPLRELATILDELLGPMSMPLVASAS
jgi:hypothetical protein